MNKRIFLIAILFLTTSPVFHRVAFGQVPNLPEVAEDPAQILAVTVADTTKMSAVQFEAWILAEARQINQAIEKPDTVKGDLHNAARILSDALLARLNADKVTTDASIRSAVNIWMMRLEQTPAGAKAAFPQAKKLIDALMQNLMISPISVAWLLQSKAFILCEEGDTLGAAAEYDKAAEAYNALHIEVDLSRIQTAVSRGDVYRKLGDKANAEAAYYIALSFPFYLVRSINVDKPLDAELESRFRNTYLRAGRNVLELRRHDLKALKETRFWPMASLELGPTLKKYTEEAEREAAGDNKPVPAE